MTALLRMVSRRYSGKHRPGRIVPWLPPACDPWAAGEAYDPMTDTALIPAIA